MSAIRNLWTKPNKQRKQDVYLSERESLSSIESVTSHGSHPDRKKPQQIVTIGGDSWKQQHYENSLESMLAELQKRGSISRQNSSGSDDSGIESLDSLSLEDIETGFTSDSNPALMPDNLPTDSGPAARDERPWDIHPTNKQDKLLQVSAKRVWANLSNETVVDIKPEKNPRQRYKTTLIETRKMLAILSESEQSSSAVRQSCSNLARAVSRSLFLAPKDQQFYTDLVQATKKASGLNADSSLPKHFSGKQFAARLKATQEAIKSQKSALEDASGPTGHLINVLGGLAAGEMGINYDPYLQGNLPYPLFSFAAGEHNATCIRMGTPTKQSAYGTEKVTPEFSAFLAGLPEGAQHLYINRQKRQGIEGGRSSTLETFQNSPESSGKLTVVTLPADGKLYQQAKPYSGDCDFDKMSDWLSDAMMKNSNGFYFPEKFKRHLGGTNEFKSFLNHAMLTMANELNIQLNQKMDVNLRRACIFHLLNKTLPELMVNALQAETYNNTCKDDIDRGGMANAYMYLCKTAPDDTKDPEKLEAWMQEVEGVALAPAITVKKREVIPHRLDDLTNPLERLKYWNK